MGVRFLGVRPHLEVRDVAASIEYYERVLGYVVRVAMGDPPVHAILERGGAEVALALADPPAVASIAAFYVDVDDVEALYGQVTGAGGEVLHEPTTHPWGMRDFVVVDPDGHKIAFGQRIAHG